MPTSRLPISEKRLAANRANAKCSTGPRTKDGKPRSSQNALKHGFCASAFTVVRLEDGNSQELFATDRIATAHQIILSGTPAIDEFERLKPLRPELPNEPNQSAKPMPPMAETFTGQARRTGCPNEPNRPGTSARIPERLTFTPGARRRHGCASQLPLRRTGLAERIAKPSASSAIHQAS